MSTLLDSAARQQLRSRFMDLGSDSPRQWGKMKPGGMVRHLIDSFRACTGERPVAARDSLVGRTVMRWIALSTPMKWPKGVKTGPEVDQAIGGTKPGDLDADVQELLEVMDRFATEVDPQRWAHPIFGRLSAAEWGRWGWRHMDHHARQFGI